MPDPRVSGLLQRLNGGQLSRRQFIRRAVALGLSAPAITALLGSPAAAAPVPAGPRAAGRFQASASTLVIADDLSGGLWLSLDPGHFYEVDPTAAMTIIYESLYHIPDTNKPDDFEPLLAAEQPVLSDDRKTATIKLREGVKFHTTGNAMTADDVVFSWNRLKNLKDTPSYLTSYWTDVEAVDPQTVKITLPEPNPALVAILCSTPLGITDSKAIKAHGGTDAENADEVEKDKGVKEWITSNSVGTGPYKVSGWDTANQVSVAKNPDYWGEPAKLDGIIWRNIKDPNSQLQAIQAGEADLAYTVDPDSVDTVKNDPNLQLLTAPTISLEYLALNVTEAVGGPLAKKEVRQAIAHAVDYDGIIQGLLGGGAEQPATVVPFPLPGSDQVKDLAPKTDVAKAQQLYDSAGVGNVQITLTYRAGGAGEGGLSEDTLATKLKSDIEKIKGLKVKLAPTDPTAWITDYRASKLQFTISPWGPDYPDVLSYTQPFGGSTGSVAKRVGYVNPQIDDLLKQVANEPDAAKRADLDAQIQKQLIEDQPYIVMYQPAYRDPARKTVQGVNAHFYYVLQLRDASKTGA